MNAIHLYRFSNYCYKKRIPFVPSIIRYIIFFLFNSVIPAQTQIGPRTRFMYAGIGVVIHKNAKIGSNVALGQGITIGRKLTDDAPIIGDDVYIAAGARVLGGIKVGNNVIVGANSVVIADVPDNSVVVGCPAKVTKKLDRNIYKILGDIL